MSVQATTLVWAAQLPRDQKYLLLCYADFADPDGYKIYPSKARVGRMTGYTKRSVFAITAKLVEAGILIPDGEGQCGTARYRMNFDALWVLGQKGGDEKTSSCKKQREGMKPASSDPPVEPPDVSLPREAAPELFKEEPPEFPELPPELRASPVLADAWRDWKAQRKALKKPLTPLAIKSQVEKLVAMGPEIGAQAIRTSIDRSWTGLFYPEPDAASPNGKEPITSDNALRLPKALSNRPRI